MKAAAPMAALARLSISLPAALMRKLDTMRAERRLPSRSQLIAELISHAVAEHEALAHPQAIFAGTITLVYRAERGRVRQQLARIEAEFLKEVISAQHVFLEDDQSLEVLLLQGPALRLRALADALRMVRGVQQLELVTTTALLPPLHDHRPPPPCRTLCPEDPAMIDETRPLLGPNPGYALADPVAARDHARAAGATRVANMPILPPVADDLPADVLPKDLLWEETIAPGGYAIRRVNRGARLRLIDLEGDACASFQIFNAEMPTERLNIADTMKVQWNGYLGAGKMLLSDMGRVLMSILHDDAGTHDCICGTSNEAMSAAKYGKGEKAGRYFLNGRDRFLLGVGKHGLGQKDVHPCVNLFKGARIEEDGMITPLIGPFPPGRSVILRAEMDLMLVIANCPHVLDPRDTWTVSPLRVTAWRGPVTPEDDAIRNDTPEAYRAFLNVEDYYRR